MPCSASKHILAEAFYDGGRQTASPILKRDAFCSRCQKRVLGA